MAGPALRSRHGRGERRMNILARRFSRLSLEKKIVAGFGLALATLVAVGVLQHRIIHKLTEIDGWVAHTNAVRTELEQAYSAVQQAEAGTRGFVATGNESFLQQHQEGISRAGKYLRTVPVLIADDPFQRQNVDKLLSLADRKIAVMQGLVALRRDRGFEAARQELNKGEELRLLNKLRALVDTMEAHEKDLLQVREAASRASGRNADIVIVLGTLLALVFGIVAAWKTRREIVQRQRAEEALAQKAKELARSNADLEQFAYVASHDLQEPLRMVASFTQLLAKRYQGKLDADADEFISYAVDGARRMQALINDLLAYSRVGTRGKELTPTNSEAVLETALRNLTATLQQSGGRVTHDPLPTVKADEIQLCQVFQNLLGNALKFHGPEPPHVHVSAQRGNGNWCFSVRDNGIGIDPENARRLFVVFQRLHTSAQYPRTGIGLAIAKKIVERHGGRIWVESEPAKGSTFYFTLGGVESRESKVESPVES